MMQYVQILRVSADVVAHLVRMLIQNDPKFLRILNAWEKFHHQLIKKIPTVGPLEDYYSCNSSHCKNSLLMTVFLIKMAETWFIPI